MFIRFLYDIYRPISWLKPLDPIERAQRRDVTIGDLRSVCVFLGPYRNLTTLTASMLSLHPECTVLNHAGMRVLNRRDLNFFKAYSPQRFENFCRFAILASSGGMRGPYGGSITHSHAFDRERTQRIHDRHHDDIHVAQPKSIAWKEPLFVSRYIRRHGIDLGHILSLNPLVRFLTPIRNPLDCAISNQKMGYGPLFTRSPFASPSLEEILTAILEELAWFFGLRRDHPSRFLAFYQDTFNRNQASRLATFLGLSPEERWLDAVQAIYKLGPPYDYPPGLVTLYRELVRDLFDPFPDEMAHLLTFA